MWDFTTKYKSSSWSKLLCLLFSVAGSEELWEREALGWRRGGGHLITGFIWILSTYILKYISAVVFLLPLNWFAATQAYWIPAYAMLTISCLLLLISELFQCLYIESRPGLQPKLEKVGWRHIQNIETMQMLHGQQILPPKKTTQVVYFDIENNSTKSHNKQPYYPFIVIESH